MIIIVKEDQSRKRNNNVAENFSIVQKLVLQLLQQKQMDNKKVSIRRMRKRAGTINISHIYSIFNAFDLRFNLCLQYFRK